MPVAVGAGGQPAQVGASFRKVAGWAGALLLPLLLPLLPQLLLLALLMLLSCMDASTHGWRGRVAVGAGGGLGGGAGRGLLPWQRQQGLLMCCHSLAAAATSALWLLQRR